MPHHHCNVCDSHCGSDECKEVYFGGPGKFVLLQPEIGRQGESFICIECLDRLREIMTTSETPVYVKEVKQFANRLIDRLLECRAKRVEDAKSHANIGEYEKALRNQTQSETLCTAVGIVRQLVREDVQQNTQESEVQ